MKPLFNNSIRLSTNTLSRPLFTCVILLVLYMFSPQVKACDRSDMTLDSVVCEAGNYRVHVTLCVGGGTQGVVNGAANATRTFAFVMYSSAPSVSVLNFTPSTVTGDSSGVTMTGLDIGPVPGFNSKATILFQEPFTTNPGFTCISTTAECGAPHSQCNQYSFLVDVLPDSIRALGIEGMGNPSSGCYPDPDMNVTGFSALAAAADAGPDTLICRGDTLTLGGNYPGGTSGLSFSWTPPTDLDNATLSNPTAWPQTTTTYSVAVSSSGGCAATSTDAATITVDTACVWPGDCNYDLTANYLDIFPIGLAYNYAGPIRPVTGFGWFGHPAFDWSGSFLNGPNHKHADSNGDGIVNFFDVGGILANYGQTHTGNRLHAANTGTLHFTFLPDSTMAGDTVWVIASLGTDTKPADSVYGVGFQLYYPPALVDSGSITVVYDSSWLGTDALDMVTLEVDNYQSGLVEIGMVRTDHIDRTGYGELCRIGIAMQDDISGKIESFIEKYAIFHFDGAVMTAADERRTFLSGETDSVLVLQNTSLPVVWQGFHGMALPAGIQLSWTTLVEINSDNFQIERAVPSEDFVTIGTIEAAGNTSQRQDYRFLDSAPSAGSNNYRIVQRDIDGTETYSPIISVMYGESDEIMLASAPVFQDDHLAFTVASTKAQSASLQLYDLQGHQLIDQSIQLGIGTNSFHPRLETLSAGVYLFHLKTATAQITRKLIRL